MRSAVVVAAVAGAASAAWAPPAGYSSGTWGESSAAPAPSSTASAAPVYSSEAPVYTTEVVTAYTTFCPEATEITQGGVTYTATEATTLTITNCPGGCTISYATSAPPATYPSPVASSPVTTISTAPGIPYPAPNSTVAWSTAASVGSTATTSSGATGSPIASAPPATGAAAKSYSAVGAAIVALFGLVATL